MHGFKWPIISARIVQVLFREPGRLGISFNGPVRGPATLTAVSRDSVAALVPSLKVGMVLTEVAGELVEVFPSTLSSRSRLPVSTTTITTTRCWSHHERNLLLRRICRIYGCVWI